MPEEIVKGIISFVEARRKETGGYGAAPRLPATVEDTYLALRILEALGDRFARSCRENIGLKNYLSHVSEVDWVAAKTTFHVLYACRLAGVPVDENRTIAVVERQVRVRFDLAERYYCARIMKEFLGAADNAVVKTIRRVHSSRLAACLLLPRNCTLVSPVHRYTLYAGVA